MQNAKSILIGFLAGVLATVGVVLILRLLCPIICPAIGNIPSSLQQKNIPMAYPSQGPENAPVVITEFADFHCVYCKKAQPALKQILQNYPDQVRLVFRHFPLSSQAGAGSFLTHEAAACAQEQGKFWEFHDAIYAMEGFPDQAALNKIAQDLGLSMKAFRNCLDSHKTEVRIREDFAEGGRRLVQGTPTFFVNQKKFAGGKSYEDWVPLIQQMLNPSPDQAEGSERPSVPLPRPTVSFNDVSGRPSKGPENAPVTLVEFSDFHCPFCGRVIPTLDKLMKNFDGKIRLVWRHYPLPMHVGADRTHEASECAHEQGKFWPYHDKLFATLGSPKEDATLISYAKELNLNEKKFKECLESGRNKSLIQEELEKGNLYGVSGTPAVFINGELVSGAYPYEHFERIIKSKLEK